MKPMTLRTAIEIIDKTRKCANASKLSGCNFSDNDTCAACPFYVTGNQFMEAVNVLYEFAKQNAKE